VWTHLVGVYDPGADKQLSLYVNGVKDGEAIFATGWNATGKVALGRSWRDDAVAAAWKGALDEVQLWGRSIVVPGQEIPALVDPVRVAEYNFEDGQGTTAVDSSGYQHDLDMSNPAASWNYGAGPDYSTALALDGTGAVVTNGPVIHTDQSFTVSAWAYLTDATRNRAVLAQDGASSESSFYLKFDHTDGADRWMFLANRDDVPDSVANAAVSSNASAQTNTWTHLTAVYDAQANQLRLYVNGALVQTTTLTWRPFDANAVFTVGRLKWHSATTDPWAGSIDRVRAYPSALTDAQVQSLLVNEP
jgi:hypothetical protein